MRIFWLIAVSALVVFPAQAGPAGDALVSVAKCTEISDAAARLQCFDLAAVSAKTVLAAAQKPADQESEGGLLSWFGFSPEAKPVTKPEEFGSNAAIAVKEDGPPEITEITATVIEYAKNAHGKSLFILDNGQVWKQIDGDSSELFRRSSDPDMKVSIEKAIMGSFSLRVEGRTGIIKVRRVK